MNKYDEKYEIRLATVDDIDNIMNYIKKEWKKDHILAIDRNFFCYEYLDGNNVNYILAIDKETNEIEGILGYIKASYDYENFDIWGVMWSVRDKKANIPYLGIELFKRLINKTKCRCEIGVGINRKTALPLLKNILKNKVGKLDHYYQLADIQEFKIAFINDRNKIVKLKKSSSKNKLLLFDKIDDIIMKYNFDENKSKIPYKDSCYINKRYFRHPIYNYLVWGIETANKNINAIIVAREVEANKSKALRIVDYIGDETLIAGLENEFKEIIKLNKYEYIDFYCYGFNKKVMESGGFILKDYKDLNIIPNYFEPFVQENIEIWFNSTKENIKICKADADQDRPSKTLVK